MATAFVRRELLAVLMESPLYFRIPLRERLEFLKLFSEQPLNQRICEYSELRINGSPISKERPS